MSRCRYISRIQRHPPNLPQQHSLLTSSPDISLPDPTAEKKSAPTPYPDSAIVSNPISNPTAKKKPPLLQKNKKITHMLSNTSTLPSKPIHHLAKAARLVIQPPELTRLVVSSAKRLNALTSPYRREDVPCGVESVLCGGVMVLC